MASRESAAVIHVAAAQWMAKIDRGLEDADQAALEAWLKEDLRHVGAFARAQAAWVQLDRAQVYAKASSRLMHARSQSPLRRYVSWGVAASAVICILTALGAWWQYTRTHIETQVGEIRQARLDDGSTVTLNTRSRLTIEYSRHVRAVRLDRGEALFTVAHGDSRPFIVSTGPLRVRDVGTEFNIRRDTGSSVDVVVTQGAVNVWTQTETPEPAVRLNKGFLLHADRGVPSVPVLLNASEIAHLTAWVDGFIDLDGQTLGEAAAEFNRYNRLAVIVTDPHLAQARVVGRFRARDPRSFAQAAAAMFNARASDDGDSIRLSR